MKIYIIDLEVNKTWLKLKTGAKPVTTGTQKPPPHSTSKYYYTHIHKVVVAASYETHERTKRQDTGLLNEMNCAP